MSTGSSSGVMSALKKDEQGTEYLDSMKETRKLEQVRMLEIFGKSNQECGQTKLIHRDAQCSHISTTPGKDQFSIQNHIIHSTLHPQADSLKQMQ